MDLGGQYRPDRNHGLGLLVTPPRGMGYTKGLHEVADGVWAYLQPDGGWGWSNAGLIAGDDSSLLVDTLFDLHLTAEMLEQMRATTPAADRIATVVNTHANGDHCYGNALLGESEIISTARCAEEMLQLPPATMAALLRSTDSLGAAGQFVQRIFSPFSFEDVPLALPTRTFERQLELQVGSRTVSLLEVGPAHTDGDAIVWLADEGIVFTGDILFHGGHPSSGPVPWPTGSRPATGSWPCIRPWSFQGTAHWPRPQHWSTSRGISNF